MMGNSISEYIKQHNNQALYIGILCIVITLPLSIHINSFFIIITCCVWVIEVAFKNDFGFIFKMDFWFLSTLYLLSTMWLINTSDFGDGIKIIETKLPLIIFPLILTSCNFKKYQLDRILLIFVVTCIVIALISQIDALLLFIESPQEKTLDGYIQYTYVQDQYPYLLRIIDIHPAYFGIYLCFCAIYLLLKLYQNYRDRKQISFTILLAFIFVVIFVFELASAMSIFIITVILISGITTLLIASKRKAYWILSGITCILVISFITYSLPVTFQRFIHRVRINFDEQYNQEMIKQFSKGYSPNNRDTRFEIWESSWKVAKRNWLFGVGTGDGKTELMNQYKRDSRKQAMRNSFGTHNQYIDFFLRHGIIGLTINLLFFTLLIYHSFKQKNILHLSLLGIMLLAMITENVLSRQKGVVFFALFNTLLFYKPDVFQIKSSLNK